MSSFGTMMVILDLHMLEFFTQLIFANVEISV